MLIHGHALMRVCWLHLCVPAHYNTDHALLLSGLGNLIAIARTALGHDQDVATDDQNEILPQSAFDLLPETTLVCAEQQISDRRGAQVGQPGPTREKNDFLDSAETIEDGNPIVGKPKAGSYLSALLKNVGDQSPLCGKNYALWTHPEIWRSVWAGTDQTISPR